MVQSEELREVGQNENKGKDKKYFSVISLFSYIKYLIIL